MENTGQEIDYTKSIHIFCKWTIKYADQHRSSISQSYVRYVTYDTFASNQIIGLASFKIELDDPPNQRRHVVYDVYESGRWTEVKVP